MSYYIGLPLVIFLALAETSFLPYFAVFGLQPNLLLVVMISWLMVRGQQEVLYLLPAGAIALSLVDAAPAGVALLALAPVAVLHDFHRARLGQSQLLVTTLFMLAATIVYQLVYLVAFASGGEAGNIGDAVLRVVIPVALLNVAVLLPVYWLTWLSSGDVRRAMFA